jgi:hypothetical protein
LAPSSSSYLILDTFVCSRKDEEERRRVREKSEAKLKEDKIKDTKNTTIETRN